jgi:hypothetical protein
LKRFTLDAQAGRIALVAETRAKENQRISAADLSEGMVIVREVRSEAGLLLVPAGSRLTSSTAAKLAQVLGPRYFVEVAAAAQGTAHPRDNSVPSFAATPYNTAAPRAR